MRDQDPLPDPDAHKLSSYQEPHVCDNQFFIQAFEAEITKTKSGC